MNKELHATTSSDSAGQQKQAGIVFPPEVRARLNAKLAQVSAAQNDAERIAALEGYRTELEVARAEEQRRMELVDFKDEKIHRFELEALNELVDQINEQYARQREANPEFKTEDVDLNSLKVGVLENSVVNIYLSSKNLIEIPIAINQMVNLQKLDLSNNQIAELKNLEELVNMQVLWLNNNQITEIKNLETLVNLQTLYLHKNQIIELKNLETLVNLRGLVLSDNKIAEIKKLETLVNLQTLWLDNNQVIEIKNLEMLVGLQWLILRGNQITEIKKLEALVGLQRLYLDNNQITEVKNLEPLVNLETLCLEKNKIDQASFAEEIAKLREEINNFQI